MRILLDHCIDRHAGRLFPAHDVRTALELGWSELTNGELLRVAATQFEVLVTVDKNLRYQQNLSLLPISVLELHTSRNRLQDLMAIAPHLPAALDAFRTHRFVSVHADGSIERLAERAPPAD